VAQRRDIAQMTHPGVASLADPLFGFAGKRVEEIFCFLFTPYSNFPKSPLSGEAEERVTERSDGWVSRLCGRLQHFPNLHQNFLCIIQYILVCKPQDIKI